MVIGIEPILDMFGADLAPAIAEVNKIVPECLSDKQKICGICHVWQ